MYITKSSSPEHIERENLSTHVELCAIRIETINKRIDFLRDRQDSFDTSLASLKFFIVKMIGVATAVIATTTSVTVIILDRLQ